MPARPEPDATFLDRPGRYLVQVTEDGRWVALVGADDTEAHFGVALPGINAAFDELARRSDADVRQAIADLSER